MTYKADQIFEAVKTMRPTKASGDDNFPTLFYQRYFHIVGKDVYDFYLEALNGRQPLDMINKTNIVFPSYKTLSP